MDELNRSVLYRGQREATWELLPQIDRELFCAYREQKGWSRERHERVLIHEFRKGVRAFLSSAPNPWEELALAQHHGLATRLLDWTTNPLVALYFSVEAQTDAPASAVWEYRSRGDLGTSSHANPYEITTVLVLDPPHVSPRISVQSGRFTVHPPDNTPPDDSAVRKFLIPNKCRKGFKRQLAKMGITRQSLFPDVDGVAWHANWLFSSLY
jgi:hypothetical protein